ncbi:MAG: efflux RND transporter permease subunit, partial [Sphingomonadales bacterium]|nr:efflux RND transporter permease subunit [Sphingomonadales bacterium]
REFSVLSRTGLTTPEQFRNIIIKLSGDHQVKLGEVARVELGATDERRASNYNGTPAIAIGVIKQSTANPLDVSEAVRAELPAIQHVIYGECFANRRSVRCEKLCPDIADIARAALPVGAGHIRAPRDDEGTVGAHRDIGLSGVELSRTELGWHTDQRTFGRDTHPHRSGFECRTRIVDRNFGPSK